MNRRSIFVLLIAILIPGYFVCGMAEDDNLEFGDSKLTDLLFYETTGGDGSLYETDATGSLQLLNSYNWSAGWSHIILGRFNGDGYTDLLFYNSTTGLARFAFTEGGAFQQSLEIQTLSAGWSHVIPGNFNGDDYTDLLFYNSTTGLARFAFTEDGDIQELSATQTLAAGLSHIIPGNFAQQDLEIMPGDELEQISEGKRYEIIVETEDEYGPGDEYPRMSILLEGAHGDSDWLKLENPVNDLEISSKRVYVFNLEDLGDLEGIHIEFDKSRARVSWDLKQVIVKTDGQSWTFPYEERLQGNGGLY